MTDQFDELVTATHLPWCDLETTGLIPDRGFIGEIALAVTEQEKTRGGIDRLVIVDEFSVVVNPLIVDHEGWPMHYKSIAQIREDSDPIVQKMHDENGLWADMEAKGVSLGTATNQALEWLYDHVQIDWSKTPLCGSTVNFDRRWLMHYAADVDDIFHYRSIDVSALKETLRRFFPTVFESWQAQKPQTKAHRGNADIRVSVDELNHYLERLAAVD